MTITDAQALIDGFAVALLKEMPQDRVVAFRDLMQKGFYALGRQLINRLLNISPLTSPLRQLTM